MFTRKRRADSVPLANSGLLTGAPGRALIMAALFSGAMASTAQAGGSACSDGTGGAGCRPAPGGSIHQTGGASGGVIRK